MYIFKRWGIHFSEKRHVLKFKKELIREFIQFVRPKIALFKELIIFMRPETCLFISGMAVSGYLLLNSLDVRLFFLFLTVFFSSATAYSLNYLTDKEEDIVNNKRLNAFVVNGRGIFAVVSFILLSFISSLFLFGSLTIFYLLLIGICIAYSALRVKEIFLVKNMYTGLAMATAFLFGAVVNHAVTTEIMAYLPFIFIFGFFINLLGDIRGYKGDKVAGIKTLPTVFGCGAAKKILYLIMGIFLASVIALNYRALFPLVPFVLLASIFLSKNDFKKTRICILSSFIALPVALMIVKNVGVI